jgi:nitrogenase molybdenum-iron protein NifN
MASAATGFELGGTDGRFDGATGRAPAATLAQTAAPLRAVPAVVRRSSAEDMAACLAELAASWPPAARDASRYAPACGEGFHDAIRGVIERLAEGGERSEHVNVLPGLVSPPDTFFLKEVLSDFGLAATILPDASRTLAGADWSRDSAKLPGGTPLAAVRSMGRARATLELSAPRDGESSPGEWLTARYGVPRRQTALPVGATLSDAFFELLEKLSGRPTPDRYQKDRRRLVDLIVSGYRHAVDKRVAIYGEQDLVVGLAGLLIDAGMLPVLVASADRTGRLRETLAGVEPELAGRAQVMEGVDIGELEDHALRLKPDLLLANGRGSILSSRLGIPLVRAGFPLYDHPGGPRILHLGYEGAHGLLQRIFKAL